MVLLASCREGVGAARPALLRLTEWRQALQEPSSPPDSRGITPPATPLEGGAPAVPAGPARHSSRKRKPTAASKQVHPPAPPPPCAAGTTGRQPPLHNVLQRSGHERNARC